MLHYLTSSCQLQLQHTDFSNQPEEIIGYTQLTLVGLLIIYESEVHCGCKLVWLDEEEYKQDC
jgi:hypothetical protein